jgi:hypothetical protein
MYILPLNIIFSFGEIFCGSTAPDKSRHITDRTISKGCPIWVARRASLIRPDTSTLHEYLPRLWREFNEPLQQMGTVSHAILSEQLSLFAIA